VIDDALRWAQPLLAPAFTLWGAPVTWAEMLAFVLSLAMVACNLRVNPLGWPLAIAASLIYALLFVDSRLYGEASLQIFFVAISLWGWWQWLRGTGDDGRRLAVRRLGARGRALALGAALAAWPLLGMLLDHATDSDVPYFDALPSTASVVAQVLLARKWVENWPAWLAINLISVALFASKGLWLTVLLYALFAGLSVVGWRAWSRLARGAQGG